MQLSKYHLIGAGIGLGIMVTSVFFIGTNLFSVILGLGILIAATPFMITTVLETKIATEKEEMFLEFSRNLVESVKVGTPISKSIINMKEKTHGVLGPYIEKLANQISLGVPVHMALQTFAKDINNKTISRAITIISEAERAGGDIGEILESVAGAVKTSDKLKKERKATISTLTVQGYIVFLIFMAIIMIMQFYILPMLTGIGGVEGIESSQASLGGLGLGFGGGGGSDVDTEQVTQELSSSFLYLLLIQGLFTGLVIGKLSEGNVKSGVKHSFALMTISFIVSAIANLFS